MNEEKKYGTKKLSIKLVGHDYVDAFENVERTGNQPHFKGDGVAVWIHDIKPKDKEDKS